MGFKKAFSRAFRKRSEIISKYGSKIPGDTQRKIQNLEVRYVDGVIGLKVKVTSHSNFVELITSQTDKIHGVSDWDGNKLPASRNLILEGIKGGYATAATGDTDLIRRYTSHIDSVEQNLLNANLIIKQFDKELVNIPVSYLFSEGKSTKNNGDSDNTYHLGNPVMLVEGSPIKMSLQYPDGKSVDNAAEHFFAVDLIGDLTRE